MITGIKLNKTSRSKLTEALHAGSFTSLISKGFEEELYKLNARSKEDIVVSLHNKIAFARNAYQRSKSPSGRMVNWTLREKEPAYIEISGIELSALLSFLNETADIQIESDLVYLVPFETTELLLGRLK